MAPVTGTREASRSQRLSLEIKEKIVFLIVALVIGSSLLDSEVRANPYEVPSNHKRFPARWYSTRVLELFNEL